MIRRLHEWSNWFDRGGKDPTWYFRWVSIVVGGGSHFVCVLIVLTIDLITSGFLHFVQTTAGWLIISTTVRRGCSFRPYQGFRVSIICIICFIIFIITNVPLLKQQRFSDKSERSPETTCKPRPCTLPWSNFCQWIGNQWLWSPLSSLSPSSS